MIEIDVPGRDRLRIESVVLDVNGTIALDGKILDGIAPLLLRLRERVGIHLVTADTHGGQAAIDRELGLTATRIGPTGQAQAKLEYIRRLGPETVAAVGNGANDAMMLSEAALGIAVIGPEGAAVEALEKAQVAVADIRDALGLLLNPKRLIGTLRR